MLKNFHCKRCGECCRQSPWLNEEDIERIEKAGCKGFFGKTPDGRFFMEIKENGDCVFLDDSSKITKCKIYKYRPDICREYPSEVRSNGDCRPEKSALDLQWKKN